MPQTVIKLAQVHIVGNMHIEVEMHCECHVRLLPNIWKFSSGVSDISFLGDAWVFLHSPVGLGYVPVLPRHGAVWSACKMACEDTHACLASADNPRFPHVFHEGS